MDYILVGGFHVLTTNSQKLDSWSIAMKLFRAFDIYCQNALRNKGKIEIKY